MMPAEPNPGSMLCAMALAVASLGCGAMSGQAGGDPPDRQQTRESTPSATLASLAQPDASAAADTGASTPGPPDVPKQPAPRPRPNILLLFVDTLRVDHVGLYGYTRDTTPQVDRYFANGTIFEWAHTTGPATRFSVPPMLFGKHYTEIHRSMGHWPRIKNSEVTMGQLMQPLGYHTGAVHTIHYFRERYNMHRGWDWWDTSCLQWRNKRKHKNPKWKNAPRFRCEWDRATAHHVTDRMIHHIETANLEASQKPWLLWAYYSDPHAPYIRHDKTAPKFGGWYHDRYDREIWYADHHIGRLLDTMDAKGMLDNTILVFTSDHGEGLSRRRDHKHLLHSSTLYENLLRIPLLFGGKKEVLERYGIRSRRVSTPVSLLDVLPTFLEAAGMRAAEVPSYFRGVSLWPWMKGDDPAHPPLFFEKHRAEDDPQKAMLDWPFKIIVTTNRRWKWSIFNLEVDPNEQKNLRYRMPAETRKAIYDKYKRWVTTVLTPAPGNFRN